MELDNYSESGPSLGGNPEVAREQSEKQKEAYRRAQAGLQKTYKDEKKAKKDSEALFAILTKFIQNPFFEMLIPLISELLERGFSVRLVLGFTALIYGESALYMLTEIDKRDQINILTHLKRYNEKISFDEKNLDPSIRNWINTWVLGFQEYMGSKGASQIQQERLATLLGQSKEEEFLITAQSQFLQFFFETRNISISQSQSWAYSAFLIKELKTLLVTLRLSMDPDLLGNDGVDVNLFFQSLDAKDV